MDTTCQIDGWGPLPIIRPTQESELGDVVRQAASEGQALYPMGGRTMLDLGNPPSKTGKAIDLTALQSVIDYPARDMTVTVQAGITLAKLDELLRGEKQRLPIDVPFPERATLGGAIATNASGARRFGCGTFRDYVIGISIINDRGEQAKAGGRVVKNVAGYDLCKLYTGALGSLGIINQITLKVKPIPEATALIVWPTRIATIAEQLEILHRSKTRPVLIEVVSDGVVPSVSRNEWSIIVGFEDNAKAVAWQLETMMAELPGFERIPDADQPTVEAALRDFALQPTATLTFKANMVPSGVPDFLKATTTLPIRPNVQAHAGNGIVKGTFSTDLTLDQAQSMITALQAITQRHLGNLVITRCPTSWKTVVPVWGRSTADRAMMRAVKDHLDPARIFNPGRFVDGI